MIDPGLGALVALDGGVAPDGEIDLLFVSASGVVGHFSGGRWTDSGRLPGTFPITWASPGEGFMAYPSELNRVFHLLPGRVEVEPIGSEGAVIATSRTESLGVVASTEAGEFFHHDGSIWRSI